MKIDWDHVYLLGWVTSEGISSLTTWRDDGTLPRINVMVSGNFKYGPPMWNGPLYSSNCNIELIPEGISDPIKYAKERGGLYAFGWYIEEGFNRKKL